MRYNYLFHDADMLLGRGHSVVLDGSFTSYGERKRAYALGEKHGAKVVVIKTVCEDEAYIRSRLWRRRMDHSRSDHEVTDYSVFRTTHELLKSQPVENDPEVQGLAVGLIEFVNHADRQVRCAGPTSSDIEAIMQLIRISPLMQSRI